MPYKFAICATGRILSGVSRVIIRRGPGTFVPTKLFHTQQLLRNKAMEDDTVCSIQNPTSHKIYAPLTPNHLVVRFLRIQKGNQQDLISCTVFEAQLDDNAEFEALSYVWGDLGETSKISLNGEPFNITTNLEMALRQLRSHSEDRVLWVDALCINQTDIAERNSQVRQMDSVYKLASRIVLWLGPEQEQTEQAMNLIHIAGEHHFEHYWFLESMESENGLYAFSSVGSLLANVYWERLWIVQEIAFARAITIHMGRFTVEYDAFMKFMSSFVETMRTYTSVFDRLTRQNFKWNYLYQFFKHQGPNMILRPGETRSKGLAAAALLQKMRIQHCREPRDHVYGVLGMTDLSGSSNDGLLIDYSKPIDQVFRDATKAIIEETGRLDIICSAQRKPIPTDSGPTWKAKLPSWTPDWSERSVTDTPLVQETDYVNLQACGQHTQAIYKFSTSGSLKVTGFCIAQIPGLAGGAPPADFGLSKASLDGITDGGKQDISLSTQNILRASWAAGTIAQCVNMLYTMTGGVEPVAYYEAFVRTVTIEWVDRRPAIMEAGVDLQQISKRYMERSINDIKQLYQRFHPNAQAVQEQYAAESQAERTIAGTFTTDEFVLLRLISNRMWNRRYFVFWRQVYNDDSRNPAQIVADNIWQGLAPVHTRKGDMVCILPGCNAPVILREIQTSEGKSYELIGEAYIESLSHGEVDDLRGGLELQEFQLQ